MHARALTFREFLNDIRLVMTSPSRRFAVIHSRGSIWGSLLLLAIPFYFGFGFAGGIYFDRDPFPGYSFILPAILAIIAALLKVYAVHICGRMMQSKGKYRMATGSYRDILALFGYTNLPSLLAMALAFTLFSLIPLQMGAFFHDFRIYAMSLMISVGVALFLWHLILVVLALRLVYPMRDYKIVFAFVIGSVILLGPAALTSAIAIPAQVSADYVRPLLNDRVLQFMDADKESGVTSSSRKIMLDLRVDRLRYRFRDPERYDLAAYDSRIDTPQKGDTIRSGGLSSFFSLQGQVLGRIVGMPGETVELCRGTLLINGQILEESYLLPQYRSDASFPSTSLAGSQYFILPENRKLLESHHNLVIDAGRVSGRAILNKWPFGWWLHRPSGYQKPTPRKAVY